MGVVVPSMSSKMALVREGNELEVILVKSLSPEDSPEGCEIVAGGRRPPETGPLIIAPGKGARACVDYLSESWHPFRVRFFILWYRWSPLRSDHRLLSCNPSGCRRLVHGSSHHQRFVWELSGRCDRPKQTGKNFSSTPLSVYCGVHPALSWNKRIARIRRSAQRLN